MLKFNLTAEQEFLCLCARHCEYLQQRNIIEMYAALDDDSLFVQAEINGMSSIAAHALAITMGEENVPMHWRERYKEVNDRTLSYMNELEKVGQLLQSSNIALLALKNSGITKGLYPYFGACPMGDVDVLVRKTDFMQAHKILINSGYKLKFRSPLEADDIDDAERGGGAEYSVTLDNGEHLWFELQWRPVAGRWIQQSQEPRSDDLVERSKPIKNSAVRLLSPEDNLIQVALHTAKHSFVRSPGFRLHTDVDRIATVEDIDWAIFTARVCQLKTKTAVYFSLAMAKTLLGTEIPDRVMESLRPNRLKVKIMNVWLERVGIFEPEAPKWGKLGYIFFVSLLFDRFSDFFDGVLPPKQQMKEQYGFSSSLLLPFYHSKRIVDLLIKRVNT